MEELMKKDLLSKLLKAGLQVQTIQVCSQLYNGKYKTSIIFRKDYGNNCWTISTFGSSEEISHSVENAYEAFISEIHRLVSCINTSYLVECKYLLKNNSILTDLNIWLEERLEGNLKTFIIHKINSSESAELLLIQAKKFILNELTKIQESIS